jgi:hypothetical protein
MNTNIFRHTTLLIAHRTKNSIQRLLKTGKLTDKKEDNFQKSGVYQLTCKDCGKKYTGQTGRSFEKRFKHLVTFKNNNYNSKFSPHLLETGHAFGNIDDIMKILHCDKMGRQLDTTERDYIYRETIINNQLNDEHTVICRRIFDTIIKRGHLTNTSAHT